MNSTPDNVMSSLDAQLDRIRGSRLYGSQAKRILAAKAYKQAAEQLESLRQQEIASLETRRGQLERRMFGHTGPADAGTFVARRDAADRAARLDDPREAAAALQRAERGGDEQMAQAIAERAHAFGWGDVVGSYAATRPGFTEVAQAYNELPDTSDGVWKMMHAARFVAPVPEELQGLQDAAISQLAQVDLDSEAA